MKITTHTPAPGRPATRKPRAAKQDWIIATPIIPVVTLRTVAPASSSNSGPLSPKRRLLNRRAIVAAGAALARRTPAMMIEKIHCNTAKPTPAEAESSPGITALIWGAKACRAAVKFREANSQVSFKRGPIKGQVSIRGGGGGMGVPSLRRAAKL